MVLPFWSICIWILSQGTGFAVGIWLVGKHNTKVVWTANRNDPPVSEDSTIVLTEYGELLYIIGQEGEKLIATNTEAASFASLHDSGNLVLYNKNSEVIWESFKYPTDTILGALATYELSTVPISKIIENLYYNSLSANNDNSTIYRATLDTDGVLRLYSHRYDETGELKAKSQWAIAKSL
ncbi:hypothetical protein GH714_021128 [Hevea brasiliensis]|uniref:Bulb-type lectin domain-containing protein n=1 Tax=Hevea brasiliensis TaxID=3981 RepID=A0A6A6K7K1_HEVBR|nr:hypothetical protein GH714_021128 [Hevea brasiliensis]